MIKSVIAGLMGGFFGAMLFSVAHNYYYQPAAIGVVDVNTLVTEHIETVTKAEELDEASRDRIGDEYQLALTSALSYIEQSQNVTLLVKPAVISGVADYTEVVRQMVQEDDHAGD